MRALWILSLALLVGCPPAADDDDFGSSDDDDAASDDDDTANSDDDDSSVIGVGNDDDATDDDDDDDPFHYTGEAWGTVSGDAVDLEGTGTADMTLDAFGRATGSATVDFPDAGATCVLSFTQAAAFGEQEESDASLQCGSLGAGATEVVFWGKPGSVTGEAELTIDSPATELYIGFEANAPE
ncbi:MAG: hypothetical protein GY898_28885 [Proteobacteria bacterium]|nr:hypothetical protein [Pseudomonadota bacterium]